MSGIKRFCLAVGSLVGILVTAALFLCMRGPVQAEARALWTHPAYVMAIELGIFILMLGFVGFFIRAVVARPPRDIEVETSDGTVIYLTRAAVASQATYLVEEDGLCLANRVRVVTGKRDRSVRVVVWVQPYRSLDVRGESCHIEARLEEGLTFLCGDHYAGCELRFLEPRETSDIELVDAPELEASYGDAAGTARKDGEAARGAAGAAPDTTPEAVAVTTPAGVAVPVAVEPTPEAAEAALEPAAVSIPMVATQDAGEEARDE